MPIDTLSAGKLSHGLRGELCVPGDKSISHRVAILAGLAKGKTSVTNFLCSEDCLHTVTAMRQLGAMVEPEPNPHSFSITGVDMHPEAPQGEIDCGNSGTGMRLLAGVLAALPFESQLTGDESLCSRPMGRIIKPLELMGAQIAACGTKPGCAPLKIVGRKLHGISYSLPVASAQVKSALLLASMFAKEPLTVHQPALTRDHTERLFAHFGIPCTTCDNGLSVRTEGAAFPQARSIDIPGDFSSAAFWMVAACVVPGSDLILRRVGLNPTRTALLHVLCRMGANIEIIDEQTSCEPYGDIVVRSAVLHGTELEKEEIPNLIDEIPILAIAAVLAEGKTIIRHAAELRVKESDRIRTVVTNLRAIGGKVEEFDDGMIITGGAPLTGCELDSFGDHRIAMSFLISALCSEGTTTLRRCENINTSYPNFAEHLQQLTQ